MTLFKYRIPHCPNIPLRGSFLVDWKLYFSDRFANPDSVVLVDMSPNDATLMPCASKYSYVNLEQHLDQTGMRAYIFSDSPLESSIVARRLSELGHAVRVLDATEIFKNYFNFKKSDGITPSYQS